MLRIIFAANPKDPMSHIIDGRIAKLKNIKGNVFSYVDTQKFPFSIEDLDLTYNQTLILKEHKSGVELSRLEGPFTKEEAEKAIDEAKEFLEKRDTL